MFHPDGPSFLELAKQALSSTVRGYDLLAPKFDLTPFRTPDALIEATLAKARLPGAEGRLATGIDLCCGTGAALPFLKAHCERVVAVDFSEGMLAEAQRRHDDLEGVEYVHGDVMALDGGGFQLACMFGAFGHIVDEERFVAMVARVLAPGGKFAFLTSEHPPWLSKGHLLARTFNATMRLRNALLKPPFIMYYLTFLLPECRQLLERNGFTVVVHEDCFDAPWQHGKIVVATKGS